MDTNMKKSNNYIELKDSVARILKLPDNIDIEITPEFSGMHESTVISTCSEGNSLKFIINKNINKITNEDILLLKDSISNDIKKSGFIPRQLSRLFGWWIIFSGSITLFAVCPVCGSAGCAGSFAFTGILAALLSIVKNFSSILTLRIKSLFKKTA